MESSHWKWRVRDAGYIFIGKCKFARVANQSEVHMLLVICVSLKIASHWMWIVDVDMDYGCACALHVDIPVIRCGLWMWIACGYPSHRMWLWIVAVDCGCRLWMWLWMWIVAVDCGCGLHVDILVIGCGYPSHWMWKLLDMGSRGEKWRGYLFWVMC